MQPSYIGDLLRVFRILAFICFIATGTLTTGAVYKLLKDHFPDYFEKKNWPFIPIAIVVFSILLYIYNWLF